MTDKHAKYFAVYPAHLMPAEQLLDAISRVTGVSQDFPGLPAGTRAGELPTPELGGDFLRVFGQPARDTVCDCERGKEPKLTQPLTLLNGGLISEKLRDRYGRRSISINWPRAWLRRASQRPAEWSSGSAPTRECRRSTRSPATARSSVAGSIRVDTGTRRLRTTLP
jgi:hypothetical protein